MRPIYGIDLGTTYTKCAIVLPSDFNVKVFNLDRASKDAPQNTLTILRSAVTVGMLGEKKVAYVGTRSIEEYTDAYETWEGEDDPPVRRFEESKMSIGEDLTRSLADDAPPWPFPPHNWKYRPEDIGAIVLRKVKKEAEAAHGPSMEQIVLTHPQNFADARRKATRQAAEIAGLEVVDMITEPDAAALAFGVENQPGTYMIFDMGGGTLDVTVFKMADKVEVISSDGLQQGGRDFDREIYKRMLDEYHTTYPNFDSSDLDDRTRQQWMRESERVKRQLGDQDVAATTYKCVNKIYQGRPKRLLVNRSDFVSWTKPLVDECVRCASSALDRARLNWSALKGIVCVGGSTR